MFVIPVFLLAVPLSIGLATVSRTKSSERARISDRASDRARWAEFRGWMLLVGAGLCIALVAMLSGSVHAGVALEARKLPMKFAWVDCQPNCRGWVSAAGIVTADSTSEFDEFARGRQLGGATIVLVSSGGFLHRPLYDWPGLLHIPPLSLTNRYGSAKVDPQCSDGLAESKSGEWTLRKLRGCDRSGAGETCQVGGSHEPHERLKGGGDPAWARVAGSPI